MKYNGVNRIYELDYIRAVSALLIVLYHYTTQYNNSIGHLGNWPISVPWGCWAVNTFFLLTGYLTLRNFKDGGIRFVLKRFFRLWPAFAVCVLITSGFMAVMLPERLRSVTDILLNFTMFPSYLGAEAVDGVYWTLPVEIIFYFWIMLFMIGKKEPVVKVCLYGWAVIAIGVSICASVDIEPLPVKLLRIAFTTERAACFILGAGIYLLERAESSKKWQAIPLLVLACMAVYLSQGLQVCLWTACWATLIWAVTSGKLRFSLQESNPLHKCILFVSTISYPLYLLHQFIGFAIIQKIELLGGYNQIWILVPFAVSMILASGVYYFVEKPAARLAANVLRQQKER